MIINYDELALKWQIESAYGPTHRIKRKILKKIVKHIRNNRVCDIGSGSGIFSRLLQDENSVYSVDVSVKTLRLAQEKSVKAKIISADAQALPFKDNFFDSVLLFDILEHTENDERVIKEAWRVLKKGGGVIFSVPQDMRLFSNIDIENGHYRRYSKQDLIKRFSNLYKITLLSSVGFPIMRIYLMLLARSTHVGNFILSKWQRNILKFGSDLLFWLFHFDLLFQGSSLGVLIYGVAKKK